MKSEVCMVWRPDRPRNSNPFDDEGRSIAAFGIEVGLVQTRDGMRRRIKLQVVGHLQVREKNEHQRRLLTIDPPTPRSSYLQRQAFKLAESWSGELDAATRPLSDPSPINRTAD